MKIRNLITYEELSSLARPCSAEREDAEAIIAEAQRIDVKSRISDGLYVALMKDTTDRRFETLLDGGEWTDRSGAVRLLSGLKTALAY